MAFDIRSRVRLNNGSEMPILGLGTASASGSECVNAVRAALDAGYRLIDTASAYGNEREVGRAVRESRVPREEIFITTKVRNGDQGYASALRACEKSLGRLGLDYVDLYLIHWPGSRKRLDTWRAMVELFEKGKARAAGVSNYTVRHLEELRAASPATPSVNQIEISPFLHPKESIEYCRRRGIVVEAYSPLTRGRRLRDPAVVEIARRYGRTPAQILIRWSLEHRFVAIPKSVGPERIRENANVFDFSLESEDVKALDELDQGLHFDWDPTDVP